MRRTLVLFLVAAGSAGCRSTSTVGTAPGATTTSATPSASAGLPPLPAGSVAAAPSAASVWRDATWARQPLAWEAVSLSVGRPPSPRWSLRSIDGGEDLRAVFASGPDDVWIGGSEGTLLRSRDRGKTFERAHLEGGEGIASVWAVESDDVWVLGEHHVHRVEKGANIATLSVRFDNHGEARVSGGSALDVWIATGALAHTGDGGASWTPIELGSTAGATDVWARSPSDVWANVPFGVRHSTDGGRSWTPATLPISVEDSFHVRGSGAAEVWILGTMGGPAVSSDGGASWRQQGLPLRPGSTELVAWADLWPTAGSTWAATSAGVWFRPVGGAWQRALAEHDVLAICASGPSDVWAVGRAGRILHGG